MVLSLRHVKLVGYLAVSPWFSTHYGLEVSYSKNWVFASDNLWFDRWTEILNLGSQYLEIITVCHGHGKYSPIDYY